MFTACGCCPVALAISPSVKLSVRQIEAKINAGNRLEEYLQGIRVMKAYNLLGGKFERLKMAYSDLRRACIRQEALLGPFILFSVTLIRAGLTFMILLRYVPVDRRRTFTAHVCHVSGSRFPCFRSVDICLD